MTASPTRRLGEHVWLDSRDERFASGLNVLVDGLDRIRHRPHTTTQLIGTQPRPPTGECSAPIRNTPSKGGAFLCADSHRVRYRLTPDL
jgi:hypothetical protein